MWRFKFKKNKQYNHSSAVLGDEAYVYSGFKHQITPARNDLHKLDMRNLTWTQIGTTPPSPWKFTECHRWTISNASPPVGTPLRSRWPRTYRHSHVRPRRRGLIAGNQLVFHGTNWSGCTKTTTWIFDVDSMTFRENTATIHENKKQHMGVTGLNSCVMTIGGIDKHQDKQNYTSSYFIRLEPKSLQQLATKTIHENHTALPWRQLPMKIIQKIMGTSPEEGWMDERVLGHFFALSRLNWAGDNLD